MAGQRVLLAGASGLVGGHLARCISADLGAGGALLLPLRRPQPDLARLGGVHLLPWPLAGIEGVDVAVCALGTTLAAAGSEAAFKAVDFDAVVSVAQAAKAAGAKRFGLVSAMGASPSSPVFYNRTKGEAEAAVVALGFECVVIAQPSLLLGERSSLGQAHRPGEAWAQRLAPAYSWAVPKRYRPIAAEHVAVALWQALQKAVPGVTRLRSDQLQRT